MLTWADTSGIIGRCNTPWCARADGADHEKSCLAPPRKSPAEHSPQIHPRLGSEGVTGGCCPAPCREQRGLESQPGRWLPSAPGTSGHRRSPEARQKTKPQPAGSGRDEVCSSQGSKKPFGVFKGMRNATYIGPPRRVGGGPALLLLLKAAPVASFLCTTVAETPIPRDLPGITLPGMHGSSRGCRAKGHRPHGAAAFLPPSQQFPDLSPFLACSGKASKGAGSERQPIKARNGKNASAAGCPPGALRATGQRAPGERGQIPCPMA